MENETEKKSGLGKPPFERPKPCYHDEYIISLLLLLSLLSAFLRSWSWSVLAVPFQS